MKKNKEKRNKEKSIIKLDKFKKKLTTKKVFKMLRIPAAVLVLVIAIFLSVRLLGNVATSNVTDALRAVPSLFSHSGTFPYSVDSLSFRKAKLIGNDIFLLTTDNAKIISSSAKERSVNQLGSADSKVITQNGRALVFSNTSNEATLYGKTEKLGSVEFDSTINTASLADNGYFAVTYSSEKAQSTVEVRNSRLKKVFQWNCSKEYVSALGISDNGKNIAVAAVGSQNAEIYSRLLIFNVGKASPLVDIRLDATMILKLVYTSHERIIAICDNKTIVMDKKGTVLSEEEYSETSLVASDCDDNGNTVICYREYGGAKIKLTRYSSSGKLTASILVDYVPDAICIRSNRFATAVENEIKIFTTKGEELKTVSANEKIKDIMLSPNSIFTVEGSTICKY